MKTREIFLSLLAVLTCTFIFLSGCGKSGSDSLSSEKAITAYSVNGVSGTINESGKTINVVLPFSADLTNLIATFTTTGSNVKIGSAIQESGVTANNFTNALIYTVTAADGTTTNYTVTVTLSSQKAITAYSINGVAGTINEAAKIISITLTDGTDYTSLVATFTTTGVSVNVGANAQASGVTANNFTLPVTYTVTAADSSTQTYAVSLVEHGKIISAMTFDALYGPSRLALKNGVAFVADGTIRVIDVSTPTLPSSINTITEPPVIIDCSPIFFMSNVSISNNKMLVGDELGGISGGWCISPPGIHYYGNLYAYDITNLSNPVMISSLGMETGGIILEGNIAYVTQAAAQPTFDVIDTSVQPTASIQGSVNINTAGGLGKTGNLIFISYYNSNNGFAGLYTADVTNQTSPSVLYTQLNTGSSGGVVSIIHPIVLSGNAAYIPNETNGLLVLDVSNPSAPAIVRTISALSSINDVAVYNGYLYAADEGGIRVFDISNVLNPVYTKTISTTPYDATLVAVSGGTGVAVFKDTSSPSSDYFFGVFLP